MHMHMTMFFLSTSNQDVRNMETRTYEGMFLLDSTQATQDWENLRKQIVAMLERRGAVIVSAKKWAERKLAYEIKGHKRGTYFLVYFTMEPKNMKILREDFQLSEFILRSLLLVHDKDFKVPENIETMEQQESAATQNPEQKDRGKDAPKENPKENSKENPEEADEDEID